jgi:hypothetical protein
MASGLLNSDAAVQFQVTMAKLKRETDKKLQIWKMEFDRQEQTSRNRLKEEAGGWNSFISELQEYDDAEEKRIMGGGRVLGEVNMDKPKPMKETQPETMPMPFKLQL